MIVFDRDCIHGTCLDKEVCNVMILCMCGEGGREEYTDYLFNNIPDTFSTMRLGVEISKLHVLSFVHHVKYLQR